MNSLNSKNNRRTLLTDLAITLFALKVLYHVSNIFYVETIENILLIFACAVTLCCFMYMKFTFMQYLMIMISTLILLFTSYMSNDSSLMITFFTVLLLKNKSIDDFIRIIFRIKVYFLIIHVIISCFLIFISPDKILTYYSGNEFRISFMTSHPNVFSLIYSWTIIEWLWINWRNIKNKNIAIIFILDVIIYMCTKTDVFILVHIAMITMFGIKKYFKKLLRILAQWIAPIMIIFTFGSSWIYDNSFSVLNPMVNQIDLLLSRRIAFISLGRSLWNFTMFGQNIDMNLGWNIEYRVNNVALDNVFALCAFKYGWIYIFIICYAFWKLAKCDNTKVNIIIITFALYALIEGQLLIVYYSFVLALLKYVLFKQTYILEGEEYDT